MNLSPENSCSLSRHRNRNPFRLLLRLFSFLFAVLALLLASCTTERTAPELGLLRFSIEVLRAGPNGQPQPGIPGTMVAYCLVPVILPEGPRKVGAANNGMMVEASWDEIVSINKDSRGVSKVRIKNLRWRLLNPVRYGTRVQNLLLTAPVPILNVGRSVEPLQPATRMVSGISDPDWQKNLFWVFGVSWMSGAEDRAPEIDVIKAYQKTRPELLRQPARRPTTPLRPK